MKCAIVDYRISEAAERSLLCSGFKIIKMPPSKMLSEAVCAHPDMLLFKDSDTIIASSAYCESCPDPFTDIREYAPSVKIHFSADEHSPTYPRDAIFNALVIGDKIFLKTDTASRAVIDYAEKRGLRIVHTNQGYPACTVLSFGNSAITRDKGMAKILEREGISVTLLSCDDILLPPHEYGFIGGACGVHGKKVYFIGNLDSHRDKDIIKEAILNEGFEPISLSEEPLRDLGRIIFID